MEALTLDIATLTQAYAGQSFDPVQLVEEIYRRTALRGDDRVWLHLRPKAHVLEQARALVARRARGEHLPLYGLPYGVKDNIDVAGLPTTAGCEALRRVPTRSATVVEKLDAAGALLLGKQNMDQFATGLVGIRTTTGHCHNVVDPAYVPGGSSSGSAVAVAAGLCTFSIGSDTGGSGRVPAACNGIVGLKPTPGVVSSRGFLYCNRSFDVPPVFALSVADAYTVLDVLVGVDAEDPYSRPAPHALAPNPLPAHWRFAIPRSDQLEFFGDTAMRAQFIRALGHLKALGGEAVEIDFAPFLEAGRLVFNSALVSERWLTYGAVIQSHPESVHPVVRTAIANANQYSAADTFATLYRLQALQRVVERTLARVDVLITPTIGRLPTCAEVEADPVNANAQMGYYTYFANPLQLAAISVPAGERDDGLPFGLGILAPAFGEAVVGAVASALESHMRTPIRRFQPTPVPAVLCEA
ncbi:MAG: allophanate hydrolase [Pseudomonadota bacterium]